MNFKTRFQFFQSISRNQIPPLVWLAANSFYNQPQSTLTDIILSLIEYIQLISQTILLHRNFYMGSGAVPQFHATLVDICRTINPGYFLNFDEDDKSVALAIFMILLCYTIFKTVFLLYMAIVVSKRDKCSKFLLLVLRLIYRLQGRFLYFFITSGWVSYFRMGYNDNFKLGDGFNVTLMTFSIIMIIAEFIFSFRLVTIFSSPIPSKSLMTAKNKYTEAITLSGKFVFQILRIVLVYDVYAAILGCTLSDLLFCLARNLYYFMAFPHYKLKAVLWQCNLLMTVTCQNIAYFMYFVLIHYYKYQLDKGFTFITWTLLTFLASLVFRTYVRKVWLNLVEQDRGWVGKFFLHRMLAIKELLRCKHTPDTKSFRIHSYNFLVNMGKTARLRSLIESKKDFSSDNSIKVISKENLRKIVTEYLQELSVKFPTDDLRKLCIAYHYAKKLKIYGRAIRILKELQQSSLANIALSASLILNSVEESVISNYKNHQTQLDLYTYMENITAVGDLKKEILIQTEQQISLYQKFIQSPQDLDALFNLAQKANHQRSVIGKKIQNLFEQIPEHFLEPLMLCAHYQSIVNHAPHHYVHYAKSYNLKYKKYEKAFLDDQLCQENIYQKNGRLWVISGNKNEIAKVKYMSPSIYESIGKDLSNDHVHTVVSENFRSNFHTLANIICESGNPVFFNLVRNTFEYNFIGKYHMPCYTYMHVNPFVSQGIFYLLLTRLIPRSEEFILLKHDGEIAGFSKNIGLNLGLTTLQKQRSDHIEINVGVISKRLARVNQAFNMVMFADNQAKAVQGQKLDSENTTGLGYEEAQNIYSVFSSEGEDIELSSISMTNTPTSKDRRRRYIYRCSFEHRVYAGVKVKMVVLRKTQRSRTDILDNGREADLELVKPSEGSWLEHDLSVESEHLVATKSQKGGDFSQTVHQLKMSNENKQESRRKTNNDDSPNTPRSPRSPRVVLTNHDNLSTQRRLLSPKILEGGPVLTERLPSERLHLKSEETIRLDLTANKGDKDKKAVKDITMSGLSNTGRNNQKSLRNQLSKDFGEVVNTKHYSKDLKLLTLLLYLVFIGVLICQISIQQFFQVDVQKLEIRKDIVKLGTTRTDYLVSIYGITRNLWMYAIGRRNQSDNIYGVFKPPFLLSRVGYYLPLLSKTNEEMMISLDSLDPESVQKLLKEDVQIFEPGSNSSNNILIDNMTTFHAIELIIEESFRGLTLASINLTAALPSYNTVLINAMNDPLVSSEARVGYLMDSVEQQKTEIVDVNLELLLISVSLLVLIFATFCNIVLKQYRNERQNMTALGKLRIIEVVKVMNRVKKFQSMLEEEVQFEDIDPSQNLQDSKSINIQEFYDSSVRHNLSHESAHKVKFEGITRKYQWYPVKFFLFMGSILGLAIVKFEVINTSINNLNYILTQIYFANSMVSRFRLAASASVDLSYTNNTQIRNQPALDQFEDEIYFIQSTTHNISDYLKTQKLTYDPIIQTILFDNACVYTSGIQAVVQYCQQLYAANMQTGLIAIMTEYGVALEDFLNRYLESNKSIQSLTAVDTETYGSRMLPMLLITEVLPSVVNRLDINFNATLNASKMCNQLSSAFLFSCLAIICFVVHSRVINRIKEADNEFRNVLKVFPAELVLSNFMLKSYLIKTFKGTLDSSLKLFT